jgi:glucokinase
VNAWRVGVDLGATKIGIGLIDPSDQVTARRRLPTRSYEGPKSVVGRISEAVNELTIELPPGMKPGALGICSPGPVDHIAGKLIDPPNLKGLHHAPLRQLLEDRLEVPVVLEHDAKSSALGEYHYGAVRGRRSMVYIVVGTGVGAAIIVDGCLFRGERNSAGEIGHITLDRYGELCSCGSHGCVETFVAGPWISRRYQQKHRQLEGDNPQVTLSAEQVAQLALKGDPLAVQSFGEAGEALGVAIASMAMVLNIDLYVVGSGVAKAGELLLAPARNTVTNYCYQSVGCNVQIVQSALGDDAPILGCGWLARQLLNKIGGYHEE